MRQHRTPTRPTLFANTVNQTGRALVPNAPLPGDLAVWDRHVAMVVGNGLSIYWTVSDPYMSEWYLQ